MKKFTISAILLLFFLAASPILALGVNLPPPRPFDVRSIDDEFVFHFNPLNDPDLPQTGLYRTTPPFEAVFTVNPEADIWHGSRENFFFSNNMLHFAFIPPASFDVAVKFFSHGELVATEYIYSLIRDRNSVVYTGTGALWMLDAEFDFYAHALLITTVEDVTFTFDIITGRMTHMTGGVPGWIITSFVLSVFGIFGFAFFRLAKRGQDAVKTPQSETHFAAEERVQAKK